MRSITGAGAERDAAPEEEAEPNFTWPSPDAPDYSSPLSESDLSGKGSEELTLMRNTIFARYGRRFKRADLRRYFNSQSWYHPNPRYHDGLLSPTEQANARAILRLQNGSYSDDG